MQRNLRFRLHFSDFSFSWVDGTGSSSSSFGRFGKDFFGKRNVLRKGEMLPVFRLDLFSGVLSSLLCVFVGLDAVLVSQ